MYAAGSSRALRPSAQSARRQCGVFHFAAAFGAAYYEVMVHAGVGEDGDALLRRAKVRLRWLVAAHAAIATLPAASGYFPEGIRNFFLSRTLEGLLLAQVMLLAFWVGLGRGRVIWRVAAAALGCVYIAIWPTIGSIFPLRHMGGGGARFPGEGRRWEDFPQTVCHYACAIGIFVAVFTAGFFIVRRWLNKLEWSPEAQNAPRGGASRYVALSGLAVTTSAVLLFIARHRATLNGPFNNWGAGSEYTWIAFPVSTTCVVCATLGAGRTRWRVLLAFLLAASMALSIWIGEVWANYAALRYYGAFDWCSIPRCVMRSLLPVAIFAATLLGVRACGYRLVRRMATRRQFTLRELLAALTLACAGLAVVVPAERQQDAVAAIKAAGGRVEYAETGETLWEFWPAYYLRDWLPRDYFDGVVKVSLDEQEAADELLAHLPGLKDLDELSLWGNHITGAGLIHLRGLRRLRYLDLDGNPISDAGLAHLRGLAHLEELSLSSAEITDAGLAHLKELSNLHWLGLNCPAVTDEGLAHLQGLTILKGLSLENARVTDAGLRRLEGLTGLRELSLYGTEVTEPGVSRLREALPNVHIHGP